MLKKILVNRRVKKLNDILDYMYYSEMFDHRRELYLEALAEFGITRTVSGEKIKYGTGDNYQSVKGMLESKSTILYTFSDGYCKLMVEFEFDGNCNSYKSKVNQSLRLSQSNGDVVKIGDFKFAGWVYAGDILKELGKLNEKLESIRTAIEFEQNKPAVQALVELKICRNVNNA